METKNRLTHVTPGFLFYRWGLPPTPSKKGDQALSIPLLFRTLPLPKLTPFLRVLLRPQLLSLTLAMPREPRADEILDTCPAAFNLWLLTASLCSSWFGARH